MRVELDAVRAQLLDGPQQRLVELAELSVVEYVSADERVAKGIRQRRQRHVDLREALVRHRLEAEAAVNDRIRPARRVREDDLIRSVRNAGAAGVGDTARVELPPRLRWPAPEERGAQVAK